MALEIGGFAEKEKNMAVIILFLEHGIVSFVQDEVIFPLWRKTCHLSDPFHLTVILKERYEIPLKCHRF